MNTSFCSSNLPRRSCSRRALGLRTAILILTLLAASDLQADSGFDRKAGAQRSASTGVRVRVAGQAHCRGCSIEDLQSLLGARPRKVLPKDPLQLPDPLRQGDDIQNLQQNVRWSVKFRDELQVRLPPLFLPA